MEKVTNTSKQARENPLEALFVAMPGGIERQEARGQQELVTSDTLPADLHGRAKPALESMGVVFGDPVEGDDLFVYATLPQGWKKVRTDHSMHSNLVDGDGRIQTLDQQADPIQSLREFHEHR